MSSNYTTHTLMSVLGALALGAACAKRPALIAADPVPAYAAHAPPGAEPHLREIAAARTHRAAIAGLVAYARWVTEDEQRKGLENFAAMQGALRANVYLDDGSAALAWVSDLGSVFPDDCTPAAHARFDRRIADMKVVADACDQVGLASALDARRAYVMRVRERLDHAAACFR